MIRRVRRDDDVTVAELAGRFDATTAPQIKAELMELIQQGRTKLVLTLSDISFIDSSGLGALVSLLRHAVAQGGDVRLADVPEFCQSIFELTRLARVFNTKESEREAIKAAETGGV